MNTNIYKLYKKRVDTKSSLPYKFYIIKNEKEVSTFQLELTELFYVGISNKIPNLREIFDKSQGIACYTDLNMLLQLIDKNIFPLRKAMKVLKELDVKNLHAHIKDFAKRGNMSEEYVLNCLTKAEGASKNEKVKQ